jgi:hypothetical protein
MHTHAHAHTDGEEDIYLNGLKAPSYRLQINFKEGKKGTIYGKIRQLD